MSWDDYLALADDRRGEYYDDAFVVSPSAVQRHQRIIARLVAAIAPQLPPSADVLSEWGWRPRPETEFIPDVVVFERTDERYLTAVPHLVVEVLSDDRGRDLLQKFHIYARLGLQRYWVIDPDGPTIITHRLVDGAFHETGRFIGDAEAALDLGVAQVNIRPASLVA
jgi:Uma2 family endonuclease